MGQRVYTQRYIHKGHVYVKDRVRWERGSWWRDKYGLIHDNDPAVSDNIIVDIGVPETVETKPVYERKDLVEIFSGIDKNDGQRMSNIYTRRRAEDVIVTDKEFDKPYVRLGTFIVGGVTPPNWKKFRDRMKLDAKVYFGADAVIFERYEVLPFKQEDYWPITEFDRPEFVRYYCVAVAFEETAALPPGVVPFEPVNDGKLPKSKK